ncbi:ATP-dependent DNA helicase RecQ-like [Pecten maximus]|uniref:ATP-dependent DNA helicase RecQ-like n=1 Tax=Pecten maximus TaxID=6579 RepID=UPI001458F3A8|nr:ATP-dependent DNA helicase RecQ-like [Pecten maximus]XP_033734348.1 ATP-dependent DNA helicase RecQ-like [Pecten maximus]
MEAIKEKEREVAERFNIESLRENQIKGLEAICTGKDVFVGTKTGSGKSMIYECVPVIFPNAIVVIVAPLVSIMKEQTDRLRNLGFKATYIGKDLAEEEYIINGEFNFVFGSPEALVGERKWRNMLTSYGDRLKVLVVDEAHTVIQWGSSEGQKDVAFREWFSHIGELRAVRPDVPIAALTATSAPSQRRKIMRSLCFRQNSVLVSESPDRKNIKISSMCIPNNSDIEDTFNWL